MAGSYDFQFEKSEIVSDPHNIFSDLFRRKWGNFIADRGLAAVEVGKGGIGQSRIASPDETEAGSAGRQSAVGLRRVLHWRADLRR